MPVSGQHMIALQGVREAVGEVRARIAAARERGGHAQDVTLIAVTKTHGKEAVEAAYAAGVVDVGENRVQEAEAKMQQVSEPVRWHLIGHLQRNKARSAMCFHLIHSVDSERLALALQDAALRVGREVDVLLQVNVSGETSKGGVMPSEVPGLGERLHGLSQLRIRGVMTMAPLEAREAELRSVFSGARAARDALREGGHPAGWLSMGMSADYEIAVEEGATHVRLGTVLFGGRT